MNKKYKLYLNTLVTTNNIINSDKTIITKNQNIVVDDVFDGAKCFEKKQFPPITATT